MPASIAQTYYDTTKVWPGGGLIEVFDADGVEIASLSIDFMRRGHVHSWAYLQYCISTACTATSDFELFFVREGGAEQSVRSLSSPNPLPGKYRIRPSCEFRVGPRFRQRNRAPIQDDESSSMSRSSRSSAEQNQFRMRLLSRDGRCIVSDVIAADAAHIVPFSRPEYYEEALGRTPRYLFDVSYGLLLNGTLHRSYDRGEWSLMADPEDPEVLIVHVFFTNEGPGLLQWHGKRIQKSRFRIFEESELPDRRLIAFHYQQCVLKHVRCFSEFPQLSQ